MIAGSGTSYTLTITNTGTEPILCWGLGVPTSVTVTGVHGPAGWKLTALKAGISGVPMPFPGPGIPPGGSATFSFTTDMPYPTGVASRLSVSSTCQAGSYVDAPVTGPGGGGGGPKANTPRCDVGEPQVASDWKREHAEKRSSTAASAKGSPLQGQCTLPPRGPCGGQQGLLINGGPRDDTLDGTPLDDTMNGQGGADTVNGRGGNDLLRGGPGRDKLDGGACDDVLFSSGSDHDAAWDGGPGNDVLNGSAVTMEGGPGDDVVLVLNGFPGGATTSGGGGNDVIVVTGYQGIVSGGAGNDWIDARNQNQDTIDCGPGIDTLYADERDAFKRCEKVILS